MNDDLPTRLSEDAPEAQPLLPALRRLRQWPAPPADTARLLAVLQPALQAQVRARRRAALAWPWLLLRAQLRVVHRELWLASALVMALGTLVAAATAGSPASAGALPLVLTAPLVTAVGAAYLFGPEGENSLELELATPVHPRVVLLARLSLLFAFDLALALAGSLLLAALHIGVGLGPLIQAWLAPMACLSALAFLLSVLLVDATSAALISLGLWGLQALRQTGAGELYLVVFRLIPDLLRPDARAGLWLAALLLAAAALWLGGQEERWFRRPA
jgi:hypothetical protein